MTASLAKLSDAISVSLHCFVVVVVVVLLCCCLIGFLEREIQKRDIHKTDNHPHPLFIITFKKKLELSEDRR